jgi:hypothetical protein
MSAHDVAEIHVVACCSCGAQFEAPTETQALDDLADHVRACDEARDRDD